MSGILIDSDKSLGNVATDLAAARVTSVGRYYNYGSGGKVLTREEAKRLTDNGISIWVVFQFWNNEPKWFTNQYGTQDAVQALHCARQVIGQPEGSAIYFAVDYDENGRNYTSGIKPYFEAVNRVFRQPNGRLPFRIGVYGNGFVCRRLQEDGLVSDSWLSCATRHAEHDSFFKSNQWTLSQTCGVPPVAGVHVESDKLNTGKVDHGEFGHLVPLVVAHTAALHAELLPAVLANTNTMDLLADDPGMPRPREFSEIADFETSRIMSNLGAPMPQQATATPARNAMDRASKPTTIELDISVAEDFLHQCMTSIPRIGYRMNAKIPRGGRPGIDFRQVDCSGFVHECIVRSQKTSLGFPDGSVNQREWVEQHGFASVDKVDGRLADGVVRIAFLKPQDSPEKIGHVVLIHNGRTIESHGGTGPDSRLWTVTGWQQYAYVFRLTAL